MLYLFWVWNWNGGSAHFGNFSTYTFVHVLPHQWKTLAETFRMIRLNIGLSWKIKIRNTSVLFPTPNRYGIRPKTGFCFYGVDNLSWPDLSDYDDTQPDNVTGLSRYPQGGCYSRPAVGPGRSSCPFPSFHNGGSTCVGTWWQGI